MLETEIYESHSDRLWGKTGEVRCPKIGEYYLAPSRVVHYAAVDFTVAYSIMREVVVDVPATYKFKE